MLSITNISAFERMLEGSLNGTHNALDLSGDWKQSAGMPYVGCPVKLNIGELAR